MSSGRNTPVGWRGALHRWLKGDSSPGDAARQPETAPAEPPARIGHYTILRKLGEGGMGAVFAAQDTRLERTVALKTIVREEDDTARQRFWREARAAASLNHPNICQIHEIGEDAGTLFIAMELLEGESLAERLQAGPMGISEALPIAADMLAALSAIHARGLIHRDLKPSNVFLTPHGLKLIDFGLAKPRLEDAAEASTTHLTRTGIVIGTPRYMAPEQAIGQPLDGRCDLFAAGAILFEMLAGRPAFGGKTIIDILHATVHEQPPALTGSPAIAAVDRVIRRALAKRPQDRFASADEFAGALRVLSHDDTDGVRALARALTRVVVLPFRVLRPDPETDFLAFSLPDAISTSLSTVGSLVVRSSATAARFAGDAPDLKVLASEADVDRVVMGTLMRAGDEVRVTAQLVETPDGTLLTSQSVHAPLGDLFALQDDLTQRLVAALSPPLSNERVPLRAATPDPQAYELYLRANELARSYGALPKARDLYVRALELDPDFAPAWAHLGRCHRVIGKFIDGSEDSERRAEQAFRRALAIDPNLSVAHKFYATLEADMGAAEGAVVRLVREATRRGNDPELFAGLVHTLRYCGLYDESIAAHHEARRLDPNLTTSLEQTLLMAGDLSQLLAVDHTAPGGGDEGIRIMALGLAGRREDASEVLAVAREKLQLPAFQAWTDYLLAWLERRPDDMRAHRSRFSALKIQDDPEAVFLMGWLACDVGQHDFGLTQLQRAIAKGYSPAPTLARSPQFDGLRSSPGFVSLQADADAGRRRALVAFGGAGGERLLGRGAIRGAA